MASIDKRASRAWRNHIREVLNRDWDPIGNVPANEYDSYVGAIAAMIRNNASDEELLQFLRRAELKCMGLSDPFNQARALSVIAALRATGLPCV
jgi:hypothetical protein